MKRFTLLLLASGLVLVACKRTWNDEEEVFMTSCQDSYLESFKSSLRPEIMQEVNQNELEKLAERQCSCIMESVKSKYDSPDEAYAKGIDALMEEVEGCDPTEKELDKLLK
jgi:hypothetical protein